MLMLQNNNNNFKILGKDLLHFIKELVKQITNKYINMNCLKTYYLILKFLIRILMIKLMKSINLDANFDDYIKFLFIIINLELIHMVLLNNQMFLQHFKHCLIYLNNINTFKIC